LRKKIEDFYVERRRIRERKRWLWWMSEGEMSLKKMKKKEMKFVEKRRSLSEKDEF